MKYKIILGSIILSLLSYGEEKNPSERYLAKNSNYEPIFWTKLSTIDNNRREQMYSNFLRVIDVQNRGKLGYTPILSGSDFDNLEAGKLKLIPNKQNEGEEIIKYTKNNGNEWNPLYDLLGGNRKAKENDTNLETNRSKKTVDFYFGNNNRIKNLEIISTEKFDVNRSKLKNEQNIKYEISGIYSDVGGYGNPSKDGISRLDTKDMSSNKIGITLQDYQKYIKGKDIDTQLKYLKNKLEEKNPDKIFSIDNNRIYSKFINRHGEEEKWEVLWNIKEVSVYDPYTNAELDESTPTNIRSSEDWFVKNFPEFYIIDKEKNEARLNPKYFTIDEKKNIGIPKKEYFNYDTIMVNGQEKIVGGVHINKNAMVFFKDLLLSTIFVYDEFTDPTRGDIIYTKDGSIYIQDKTDYSKDALQMKIDYVSQKLDDIIDKNGMGSNDSGIQEYFKDKKEMSESDFKNKWVNPFLPGGEFESDLKAWIKETDENISFHTQKESIRKEIENEIEVMKEKYLPSDFYNYIFGDENEKDKYKRKQPLEVQKVIEKYDVKKKQLDNIENDIKQLDEEIKNIAKKYHFFDNWQATEEEKKWLKFVVPDSKLSLLKHGKNVCLYDRGIIDGVVNLGEGINELHIMPKPLEGIATKIILSPTAVLKNIRVVRIGKQFGDKVSTTGKTTLAIDIDEKVRNNDDEIIGNALYNSDKNIIFINGDTSNNDARNDFVIELMTSKIGKDAKINVGHPLQYQGPALAYLWSDTTINSYKLSFITDSIIDNVVELDKQKGILEVRKKKELKRLSPEENNVYKSILLSGQLGYLSDTLSTINKRTSFTSFDEKRQQDKRVKLINYLLNSTMDNEEMELMNISQLKFEKEQIIELLALVHSIKNNSQFKQSVLKIRQLPELKKIDFDSKDVKRYEEIKKIIEKNKQYYGAEKTEVEIKADLRKIADESEKIYDSSLEVLKNKIQLFKQEDVVKIIEKINGIKNIIDEMEYSSSSLYSSVNEEKIIKYMKDLESSIKEFDTVLENIKNILAGDIEKELKLEIAKDMYSQNGGKEFIELFSRIYYTPKQEESLEELKTILNQISRKNIYSRVNKISKNEIDVFQPVVFGHKYDFSKNGIQTRGGFESGRFSHSNFKGNIYTAYGIVEQSIDKHKSVGIIFGGGSSDHNEIKNDTLKTMTTTSKIKGNRLYIGSFYKQFVTPTTEWVSGFGSQYSLYNVNRNIRNNYQNETYTGKVNVFAGDIYTGLEYDYKIEENLFLKLNTSLSYTMINQGKVKEDKKPLAIRIDSKNFNYLDGEIGIGLTKKIFVDEIESSLTGNVSLIHGLVGYNNSDLEGQIDGSDSKFAIKGYRYKRDAIKVNLDYNVSTKSGFSYGIQGTYIKNNEEDNISIGVKAGYKF